MLIVCLMVEHSAAGPHSGTQLLTGAASSAPSGCRGWHPIAAALSSRGRGSRHHVQSTVIWQHLTCWQHPVHQLLPCCSAVRCTSAHQLHCQAQSMLHVDCGSG